MQFLKVLAVIKIAFTFCTINIFFAFNQGQTHKAYLPKLDYITVWLSHTHLKQCTTCLHINYHNTTNKSGYFPQFEQLLSLNILAHVKMLPNFLLIWILQTSSSKFSAIKFLFLFFLVPFLTRLFLTSLFVFSPLLFLLFIYFFSQQLILEYLSSSIFPLFLFIILLPILNFPFLLHIFFLLFFFISSFSFTYSPNPSSQAGYDTRSIFKRSLTGFNSEFSFP